MKIIRDILCQLRQWQQRADRKPLILQGARQIGKTTVVRDFAQQSYRYLAEFNFDRNDDLHLIFQRTKDVKQILKELSFVSTVPIIAGETLIFFDEIQECAEALGSLKYFCEDAPEQHILAAGSLMGVAINHSGMSFPVGKVNFLNMFPVTFKEYLHSADEQLYNAVEEIVSNRYEPLPEIVCNRLQQHYKHYQVCGGLPYVTVAMLDNLGIETMELRLNELLKAYANDFSKYVERKDIPRIHEIWQSIPSQLSRENKKFVFRVVREGARAREYETALNWLNMSGLVHKVLLTETPMQPMSFYEDTTSFKVYMLDIGLLRRLAQLPAEVILSSNEMFREFKGAVAENLLLLSLLAAGYDIPHYWTLHGNQAEVDFLLNYGLDILPIEVKADTRISGKSFAEYDKKYHPHLRVRFSMKNLKQDGNLLNIPLYLADWLRKLL